MNIFNKILEENFEWKLEYLTQTLEIFLAYPRLAYNFVSPSPNVVKSLKKFDVGHTKNPKYGATIKPNSLFRSQFSNVATLYDCLHTGGEKLSVSPIRLGLCIASATERLYKYNV